MFNSISSIEFGEYLKALRKKMKITQNTITDMTGINPDTIRKIENGQVIPRYDTLAVLSNVYKVNLVQKFTEYQNDTTLLNMYSNLDRYILNNDIDSLNQLKEKLAYIDKNEATYSNLINKTELEQFIVFVSVLELHLKDSALSTSDSINKLQNALQLSIPKFSVNAFNNFTYNSFEIRLLLLYGILWGENGNFNLSNNILFFILGYLNYLFPDEQTTARFLIKVHFNISYNYHRLSEYENSLAYADKGIQIAESKLIFTDLHALYYRKFTAEMRLDHPGYMYALRKCIRIMDLLGNKTLMNQYIQITKKAYEIDLEDDPLLTDIIHMNASIK